MSGFFGIVREEGGPIDEGLLQEIAEQLRFRGPDGVNVWSEDGIGGCFTKQSEQQPVKVDQRFLLWGDVRPDAREELRRQLAESGRELGEDLSSEEYFLQTWQAWSCGAYGLSNSSETWGTRLSVPFQCTNDEIWVTPGYPRVCLWPEAAEGLVGEAAALPQLTTVWEKRLLPLDGVRGKFASEKVQLGLIYLIGERSRAANAPRIEEVAPREALLDLVRRTYMNRVLDRPRRAEEFDVLGKVVSQVPVRRIFAHEDAGKIGELGGLILADVREILGRVNCVDIDGRTVPQQAGSPHPDVN